ncbi:MAG: polysaccharide deacetylase family protein [Acetobacteraceae bacterium]
MCTTCRGSLSRRRFGQSLLAVTTFPACVAGGGETVVDPRMRLVVPPGPPRSVALTLDACGGGADMRVISLLLERSIPATIFVTALWLQANPSTLALLRARPDLFSLQNHGEHHVPPVLGQRRIYGLAVAGTLDAVRQEVDAGAAAVVAAGAPRPTWYRGATALYSEAALQAIEAAGFRIAAYSLNADRGASLPAASVAARVAAAVSGDIIIGHINQPHRQSGAGLAAGIAELHRAGAAFVTLDALPVTKLDCRRGHGELVA